MINTESIKARAKAATPGPWKVAVKGNSVKSHAIVTASGMSKNICSGISPRGNNADFIAHAREDIPALIAEIDRLNSKLQEASEQIEWDNNEVKALTSRAERAEVERDKAVEKACSLCEKHETTAICASSNGEWCEIYTSTKSWADYVKRRDSTNGAANNEKQITETDLYTLYLDNGFDDVMPFLDFLARCELSGIDVVKEASE